MPVKRTMMIAQQLYEGIELPGEDSVGLITYMRTDSTRVSAEAIADVREHIGRAFGDEFVPEQAERVPDEGRRPGRARSDPADVDAVRPGDGQAASDAGAVLPVPPDLEPFRGLADAAGALRRHDGRHHRRRLHVPRQGIGPEVQGVDGRARPRRRQDGRGPRRGRQR